MVSKILRKMEVRRGFVQIPEIEVFSIVHKTNGKHVVFQFRKGELLTQFL